MHDHAPLTAQGWAGLAMVNWGYLINNANNAPLLGSVTSFSVVRFFSGIGPLKIRLKMLCVQSNCQAYVSTEPPVLEHENQRLDEEIISSIKWTF